VTPQMKIRCCCGAQIEIPIDLLMKQRDKVALQFYEMHAECKESHIAQARAVESMSQTLHDIAVTLNEFLDMAQAESK